ncbi:MAG: hypothetical protein K9J06_11005 [Flavobacteriales bacterium]|nr:hypothetical protein [Flavobacteriales bacterium]
MISPYWFIFVLVVLVLAYLSATYHNQQGLSFWRTFIMSIIGFAGLGLLIAKMLLSM